MENMTKALLMAAAVLIGIIILSLALYVFYIFGEQAASTQNRIDEQKLAKFNNEFLKYSDSTTLTIQDIITAKNYALQNNRQYINYNIDTDRAEDGNDYVDVYYAESEVIAKLEIASALIINVPDENLLSEEMEKIRTGANPRRFSCDIDVNEITGKVNKVYFFANP